MVSKEGKLLDLKEISAIVHMSTSEKAKGIQVLNGMA
jgi:hypothetical protein